LTLDIGLTLAVTAAALGLFIWNRLRIEVVGFLVMVAVILLGLVEPAEGIAGFANEATLTVALMLGLSTALVRTGAVDQLGQVIERLAGQSEGRLLVVLVAVVVPVSALINNTAAIAILLPVVMGLSRRASVPPSGLLMPLSFASQLGGMLTLVGTSTNLLVAGMIVDRGLDRLSIFDVTPPALLMAAAGVAYLLTFGRRLTPRRQPPEEPLTSSDLRDYLTQLAVDGSSPLVGRDLESSGLEDGSGLHVVGVLRRDERLNPREEDFRFREGDQLLVRGDPESIAELAVADHLIPGVTASELEADERLSGEPKLAEMIVSPRSRVVGRRLGDLRFEPSIQTLAIQRHGEELRGRLQDAELEPGDVLLARAPLEHLEALHEEGDFALFGVVEVTPTRSHRRTWSILILVGVIALAASGVTTILVSALAGMALMVLTGCVRAEEVYRDMDWRVVVLLGTLLALGEALETTGTAEFLADGLLTGIRPLGPYGVLAAFYLLTSLLTAVISNNAAALVVTPVAVATARSMGISAMPLVVAVMFAASNGFLTPVSYQTNLFVYSPGGYRFTDFARVGAPLVLLMLVVATLAIPFFFPF